MKYCSPEFVTVLRPNLGYFAALFSTGAPNSGISQRHEAPQKEATIGFRGMDFVIPRAVNFTPEAAARYYATMLGRRLDMADYLLPDKLPYLEPAIRVTLHRGLFPSDQIDRVYSLKEMGLPIIYERNLGFISTRTAVLHPNENLEHSPDQLLQIAYNGAMMREKLM